MVAQLKVYVSGASGFVGANLVRRLVSEGYEVVCLMRNNTQHPFLSGLKFTRRYCDLCDNKSVYAAIDDGDAIFHCAGLILPKNSPDSMWGVNVEGTRALIDAAQDAGIKKNNLH